MPYLPPQHPQVSRPDKRKTWRRRSFSARGANAFGRRLKLLRKLGLAQLHPLPQLIIDNTKFGHLERMGLSKKIGDAEEAVWLGADCGSAS
jgi:hypothetical protein